MCFFKLDSAKAHTILTAGGKSDLDGYTVMTNKKIFFCLCFQNIDYWDKMCY